LWIDELREFSGLIGLRIAVFLGLLLAALPLRAQVIDRVLAVVNGRMVTLSDVRTTGMLGLTPAPTDERGVAAALDRWIERLLVLQEVERFAPPEPSPTAVDARLSAALARLGSPSDAKARLAALEVDEAWVRQWVRDDLRIQSYTEQRFAGALEPTAEELENYYREHAAEFVRDSRELPPEEAQTLARQRVMAARRLALVADWLDGLRRRATIVRPASRRP
jgi:hypothetical protein